MSRTPQAACGSSRHSPRALMPGSDSRTPWMPGARAGLSCPQPEIPTVAGYLGLFLADPPWRWGASGKVACQLHSSLTNQVEMRVPGGSILLFRRPSTRRNRQDISGGQKVEHDQYRFGSRGSRSRQFRTSTRTPPRTRCGRDFSLVAVHADGGAAGGEVHSARFDETQSWLGRGDRLSPEQRSAASRQRAAGWLDGV